MVDQRPTLEQQVAWLGEAEDAMANPEATHMERRLGLIVKRLVSALFAEELDRDLVAHQDARSDEER
ncbi:MAG TPA: hypothetical protein VI452_09810 [Marmoricola sp.]